MREKFLFFLVLTLDMLNVSAQTAARNSGGFPTVEAYLASIQTSEHLQHLLNDANDALYVTASGVHTYGSAPAVLYADAVAFNRVANLGVPVGSIEMATIRIKRAAELSTSLDLSSLSGYSGLKYVYILCTTQANAQAINNLVRNVPANVAVFYKIDSGS